MALPVRIWIPFWQFASFSILDVTIVLLSLFVSVVCLVQGYVNVGNTYIMSFLFVPFVISAISMIWSTDISATIRWIIIFGESVSAYLITIYIFKDFRPGKIMRYISLFAILLIVAAILSLLRIPGFTPQIDPTIELSSAEYSAYMTSFYARFSHPFIGLSNNFATVLVFPVFILFGYGVLQKEKLYIIIAFISGLALIMTMSRGVILAVLISFAIYVSLSRSLAKKWPRFSITLLMLGVMFYVFYKINPEVAVYFIDRFSRGNLDIRMDKILLAFEAISNQPWLGYGAGVAADGEPGLVGGVHNTFIEQILYFGVFFGMVVNASLVLLFLRFLEWRTWNERARFIARAVAFAVVAQLLVFVSQTSFEGSVLRVLFYFSFGMATALLRSMERDNHGVQLVKLVPANRTGVLGGIRL